MYKKNRPSDAYYNRTYTARYKRPKTWRSTNRQWDYIVCAPCIGCGKPLGRYENLNKLVFCFECREVLFPETFPPRHSRWKNAPY